MVTINKDHSILLFDDHDHDVKEAMRRGRSFRTSRSDLMVDLHARIRF